MISVMTVVVALVASGCASGEGYTRKGFDFSKVKKAAVIDVVGSLPGGQAGQNQIADYFNIELIQKGYVVVERQQVLAVLKEQKFQTSGVTSNEDAARAGRILNVPAVVVVNIPEYGEHLSMTAKMIDTEDASILWIGSGRGSTGRTAATVGGAVAGAAAGVLLGGDRTGSVVGGAAGGVAGGLAGDALSPRESRVAQNVIRKMCRSLPSQ